MSEIADGDIDYSKLKVSDLKQELKKRGLSTEGKKSELIERLQSSSDSALLDDPHDDLLDDEDLSDDVLNDTPMDVSPQTTVPAKEDTEKRHPKKIILNRRVVDTPEPPSDEPAQKVETKEQPPKTKIAITAPTSETSSVSGLSLKEKLDKRAARFGTTKETSTVVSKPEKSQPAASKPLITTNTSVNLEVLKKRAERFGTVAPILEKAELEERKKQRINRFGGGSEVAKDTNGAPADKKALRAARFQIKS